MSRHYGPRWDKLCHRETQFSASHFSPSDSSKLLTTGCLRMLMPRKSLVPGFNCLEIPTTSLLFLTTEDVEEFRTTLKNVLCMSRKTKSLPEGYVSRCFLNILSSVSPQGVNGLQELRALCSRPRIPRILVRLRGDHEQKVYSN